MVRPPGVHGLGALEPVLGRDCFIAPGARVIGEVVLGDEVGIWFNAVLRGDVERLTVGGRSNVQDGAVLHADPGQPLVLGPEVTVGHRAVLHGCRVGEGALVGINAVVLNGAEIGAESVVGACALVPEGRVLPARSLILGAPARVVRELSEAEVAGLRAAAAHYVNNARRYREGLDPKPG